MGTDRVDAAKRAGNETLGKAKSATGKAPSRLADRAKGWRGSDKGTSDPE